MKDSKIITPNGFSPGFQSRIESAMLQKNANVPGLPPQIAMEVNNGIMAALTENRFSQIELALGALGTETKKIRILIFRDKINEGKATKLPETTAEMAEMIEGEVPSDK